MKFDIQDMTCGGCARGVTRAIQDLDPGAQVEADTVARRIEVRTSADAEAVAAAIVRAGFTPVPA
ncbi:heavy-metal-associated domain-containing protein [Caulobacter mirabilis]|uniref:Heavy metal transport/detoxification protein n=1 Tax=Caulobacter mirabilis TaxID=69666 RepID=A0A2D2AZ98_9CAUL|nr:heavy-metal-associated domain-containing protein [Caulobacter mirabilis]ATQ43340.1 heavy metal transport/detoxification protein [Caulobacter mirabilis]